MALAGAHFILRRAVAVNLYAAADFSASVEREFLVGRIHASVLLVANKLWILYKKAVRDSVYPALEIWLFPAYMNHR